MFTWPSKHSRKRKPVFLKIILEYLKGKDTLDNVVLDRIKRQKGHIWNVFSDRVADLRRKHSNATTNIEITATTTTDCNRSVPLAFCSHSMFFPFFAPPFLSKRDPHNPTTVLNHSIILLL